MVWDNPDDKGVTFRDKMEHVRKSRPKKDLPPGLPPDVRPPLAGRHLWSIFWELSSGRGSNGMGPNPITYAEIHAWTQLTATPLLPWEVSALTRMDVAYFASIADAKSKSKTRK